MSSLRAALMVAGAAFLALLAAWEVHRARRTAAGPLPPIGAAGAAARAAAEETQPDPMAGYEGGAYEGGAGGRAYTPEEEAAALAETNPGLETQPDPRAAEGPIVEWPPEGSRVIVALRLVSVMPGRFSGYALRQALQAEGFVLGKHSIFHKAQETGRAYLSAASLTQPGAFNPDNMDSQRYSGLSLFAVLPGPKPAFDTFDDLLTVSRGLNDRLQGALQDEHGLPLTPLRVAGLRRRLQEQLPG